MKAQISTEYLIILGLIFIFIIPFFYYSVQESSLNIRINGASDTVVTIAKAADSAYALCNGSLDTIVVNLPSGIDSFQIINKEIVMKLKKGSITSDIIALSKVPVTCTYSTSPTCSDLPTSKGIKYLKIECCTLINNTLTVNILGG